MKQLVILSGKGGTGKTTVAAALAHLASEEMPVVLVDADVDAANLELVLGPTKLEEHDFTGGQVAVIDPDTCTDCGICAEVCRFEAIISPTTDAQKNAGRGKGNLSYHIDPIACEGCASCFYQCPAEAIRMEEQTAGRWFRSDTRFGPRAEPVEAPLFHAHLFAAQENSGKLVTLVKQQGRLRALDEGRELLIVDGPPGIGCPVISASAGADLALLVVEPTVSGVHDLERILATTDHFGVPALVCINKVDVNPRRAAEIEAFCADPSTALRPFDYAQGRLRSGQAQGRQGSGQGSGHRQGIEVVGRIPFDTVVTEAMVQGQPVTAYTDGPVSLALREVWERLKAYIKENEE